MKKEIKIKLQSDNLQSITEVINQLSQVSQMYNLELVGPIPLPTKELKVTVRRTPCGDGSDTYETWRRRIHKRYIIVIGNEKELRNILKIKIPTDIQIQVKL
jgi:small subunit ribosomal protein S10